MYDDDDEYPDAQGYVQVPEFPGWAYTRLYEQIIDHDTIHLVVFYDEMTHDHTTDRYPDDGHQEAIDLEACWRCFTRIPRGDDLGLCKSCVQALQDL